MKKQNQLGMNPSTASNRLVKDILFKLAVDAGHKCFQCGNDLNRETFTIEHKTPWLDSEDPLALYFDLENIAFSHHGCNVGARRKEPSKHGTASKYTTGCRCNECRQAHSEAAKESYDSEQRYVKYTKTGN